MSKITCEICGGGDNRLLSNVGKVGVDENKQPIYGELNFYICGSCGHIVLHRPECDEAANREYYNDLYRKNAFGEQDNKPSEAYIKSQIERGEALMNSFNVTDCKVVDIGCASGYVGKVFQDAGYEVHGLEPNKASVDACEIPCIHSSLEELDGDPWGGDKIIFMLGTIEHVYDLQKATEKLKGIITYNSDLFFRTRARPFENINQWLNINHWRYFSEKSLEIYLERFGGYVQEYQGCEGQEWAHWYNYHVVSFDNPAGDLISLCKPVNVDFEKKGLLWE